MMILASDLVCFSQAAGWLQHGGIENPTARGVSLIICEGRVLSVRGQARIPNLSLRHGN